MNTHTDVAQESEHQSPSNDFSLDTAIGGSATPFEDNRPEVAMQLKQQEMANSSSQVAQLMAYQQTANQGSQPGQVAQLQGLSASQMSQAPLQLLKDSEITSTAGGNGASKATVLYLKRNRPQYADDQVDAVWDAAPKDGTGRATCPNSLIKITWAKGTPRQGVWDMGHIAGHEYRTLWEALATSAINYAQFIASYQNPANYQVEDCNANRGHQYEA